MAKLNSVRQIVERVGRIWCLEALNISERALLRYMQEDKIPAKYFDVMERKCGRLPRDLFTFVVTD